MNKFLLILSVWVIYSGCIDKKSTGPEEINTAPVATVDLKQQYGEVGDEFILEGSGYDDDLDAITYLWTESENNPVSQLLDASSTRVTTVKITAPGTYTFHFSVNDGKQLSREEEVKITVTVPPLEKLLVIDLPFDQKMEFVWVKPGNFEMSSE